jgi:branched-subunit amino acid aminotransferase/4-amino-4-deoxychorismate lyase
MNLFWIKNGELFTSSLACGALAGVTRETVMQLSREMPGRKVHEGKYRPAVLSEADEMFICGTGSGITPITRFEKTKLSSGNSRSITARLWDLYSSTLRSRPERYADWFLPCQ